MLITNPDSMWGTVYDDTNKLALQLKIGDCLSFGSFIPNETYQAPSIRVPMLWHVIDKKNNRLKLLSYFFFEHMGYWPMDNSKTGAWEATEIRDLLNDQWFHDCFTDSERNAILTTDVKTRTGDSSFVVTRDKLYVPALEDIENIPEHLKIGRGLTVENTGKDTFAVNLMYCFYWLRDPGDYEDENLVVQGYADKKIVLDSLEHDADEVGVRAVMWVDAEKIDK